MTVAWLEKVFSGRLKLVCVLVRLIYIAAHPVPRANPPYTRSRGLGGCYGRSHIHCDHHH